MTHSPVWKSFLTIYLQDGAPYIISNEANRVANHTEERAQGYSVISITTFKSLEDYEYYDKECKAHAKLRDYAATIRTGFATLQFESDLGQRKD